MLTLTTEDIARRVVGKRGEAALKILTNLGDIADPKEWEKIVDKLLDFNIEVCPNCKIWCNSNELLSYSTNKIDGYCDSCRPIEKTLSDFCY